MSYPLRQNRSIFFLNVCLSLMLPVAGHPQKICGSEDSTTVISGTGKVFNQVALSAAIPRFSGSVLVAEKKDVLLKREYQNTKRKEPCEGLHERSYWIASLSKQFCAAAILKLNDSGQLNLNDSISKFIETIPRDKSAITIHQLLTHTSGMPDLYSADGISERNKAIEMILKDDLLFLPGTNYAYSNQGYNLLAILVEIVAGVPYEEFLAVHFFQPLSLTMSGHIGDQGVHQQLSVAPPEKKVKSGIGPSPQGWAVNYGYKGSTGVLSSPTDLSIWFHNLYQGNVLSKERTALLFKRHVVKSEKVFYGYGWNLFNDAIGEVIVHSGYDDFIGHSSTLRFYPGSGKLFIVLSNTKGLDAKRPIAQSLVRKFLNSMNRE